MAQRVRAAYLTLVLLYLTLLDTAISTYPRIRLTYKGKKNQLLPVSDKSSHDSVPLLLQKSAYKHIKKHL